jgi:Na+/proline symporter
MTGSFAAAVYALRQPQVGGLSGLISKVAPQTMNMVPDLGNWSAALPIFIMPIAVQWWATWYPGGEPGGGSYIAQRMLAARSERDALSGTLLFNVAHYALRPWPWIIVALCSMIVFPHVSDIARALPQVDPSLLGDDMAYSAMLTFLPEGMLGLMVAGLLAAYVSTISTHLNWGTSYLVHDFYRRFIRTGQDEQHYVLVGRVVTAVLMIAAGFFTLLMQTARDNFDLMLSVGAGTGLLYLLRWFWWRINAWSEIAAMISSFLIATVLFIAGRRGFAIPTHIGLLATIATTTVVWLVVTGMTAPADPETLQRFYRKVRPAGPGWAPVRRACGNLSSTDNLSLAFVGWISGCTFVFSALFGAGYFLLGKTPAGVVAAVVFVVSGAVLYKLLPHVWGAGTRE